MRAERKRTGLLPLRVAVIAYLVLLLVGPVILVFARAFEKGIGEAWTAIPSAAALHALEYTLLMAAIAVPLNAVFGVGAALLLARGPKWLRPPLGAPLLLPLAVPPRGL